MNTENSFPVESQPTVPAAAQHGNPAAGNGFAPAREAGYSGWPNSLHAAALLVGGVSTILVALRLLSVAKANPETAYGILQAGGTANVIIGTVLSLIPSIALIAASYLALGQIWAKFTNSRKLTQLEELGIWASICALFLIAILTIPFRYWPAPAALGLALILAWIFRDWIEEKRQKDSGRHAVRATALVIASAFLFGVIVSPPWMPAENLTFTRASGHAPVVGYILSQSGTGLTVLAIDPRQIFYFGPQELSKETSCSAFPQDELPIVYHVGLNRILHLSTDPHC
jgi:hypothetical protein